MAEICPICGEEIVLGACGGCGFEPPDLNEIAAPYDLDPSNDHFGEADPAEGMFPQIDAVGIADEPEYDIPSIALPSITSANSPGKLASVGIQPAPNIRVRPAVQAVQAVSPAKSGQNPLSVHTAQSVQSVQPVYSQQNFGQTASPLVRFVKGTADYFASNWWKFLIMAIAPTTGLFFAGYFAVKYKAYHRFTDVMTAILFGVVSMCLMINGWDLFGIDGILQTILSFIFGE